jgi:cell wall assembly regulator SMI1
MPSKTSQPSIANSWKQIEDWLVNNWEGEHCLPPAATSDNIQQAEAAFGQKLPKQVSDCYAVHNGTGAITLFSLWDEQFPLMSLSDAVGIWRSIQKTVARRSYDYPEFVNHPVGPIKKGPAQK